MEVSAAITLEEEVFNEELENKSSARYQEMEKNVKQEVRRQRPSLTGLRMRSHFSLILGNHSLVMKFF